MPACDTGRHRKTTMETTLYAICYGSAMNHLPIHTRIIILLTIALLTVVIAPTPRAYAAVIGVNTFSDELIGDGNCSLREAIQAANINAPVDACPAGSGADTILLAAGRYTLSIGGSGEDLNQTGDLDISSDLTIAGVDFFTTVIDAAHIDRVLHIFPGTHVTLSGMSVVNGTSSQNGGGIYNDQATLTLNRVTVDTNTASGNGGAILNHNAALTISSGTLSSNMAAGHGGAIENEQGTVQLIQSTINDNIATNDGGAIRNSATLMMDNVWVHDNQSHGLGGGIYNTGQATISGSPIHNNSATLSGGNIYTSGATSSLTISSSSVSRGYSQQNGGGIYNDGALNATNVTINSNRAVFGDGIYNNSGNIQPVSLTNTTIVSNTNTPVSAGEGIYTNGATLTLKNTLVAFNGASGDCLGSIVSAGYNLEYGNSCSLTAAGDITGTDPLLGSFANSSGKTDILALLPASPAINAGTNAGCPSTDQRGVSRPHGPRCDIGAYESNAAPIAVGDIFSIPENTPLVQSAPGVLVNDSDPDGDMVTATLITGTAHGLLVLQPNGSFSYTPDANFSGVDSFSYRIDDGSLTSASATVTLTVTAVNDPPVAGNDTASTQANQILTIPASALLNNDSDSEGDVLTIGAVSASSARGGSVALSGGSVIYTPPPNFSGVDSFTYTLSDGHGGTANGTVTITVTLRRIYLAVARR
jgi:CSLREA domain-containing protein